jgi:hypothetical protein
MPDHLYIRWSQTEDANGDAIDDNRTDPGAGAVYYKSASLQVINPNDPNQDEGRAIVGAAQQIRVKVDSLTVTTTNVEVQAWACAWGTAGQPFLPSANGFDGLLAQVDDQLNPYTADPAPPAQQLAVDLDWTPTSDDLDQIGETGNADLHVCLYANCYSLAGTGDGAALPGPGRPAINVPTNRHHGQRNIRLVTVPSGMAMAKFKMFSGNPFADGEDLFVLEAAEVRRPALGKRDLARLQKGRWLRDDGELSGRGGKLQPAEKPVRDISLRVNERESRKGIVEVPLRGRKQPPVEVEVAVPQAAPGTLHVLDIAHRHRKRVVGGAGVLLLTVDEERYEALTPERATAV